MSVDVTVKNLNAVLWGLGKGQDDLGLATGYAVGQVALAIEREIKKELGKVSRSRIIRKGRVVGHRIKDGNGGWKREDHHIGGDGSPPNRITGNLQRSVTTEMPRPAKGFRTYTAITGPTAIYARQLEMGGGRWKTGVKYPYVAPSYERMMPRVEGIFNEAFLRKWQNG
jgi:hypothetical protein